MTGDSSSGAAGSSGWPRGGRAKPGREPKGLEGAKARGRAAKEAWVRDGLLVSRETFAQQGGLTVSEVAEMAARGELFELEVGGQLWLPAVFLEVPKDVVVEVNRALAGTGVDTAEAFVFWHCKHGALGGMAVAEGHRHGAAVGQVVKLARGFTNR